MHWRCVQNCWSPVHRQTSLVGVKGALVCGLSITTVNKIIDDSEFISGIADIWDKYGVLEYSTAEKLWEIIKSHVNESVVSEKDEKPLVSQSSSESETCYIQS